jgi:PAS domain S-box-containing protein
MTARDGQPVMAAEVWRGMVERSPLGWVFLQDGRIAYCNDALCALCGYSREEILAMTAAEVAACIHPEDRERALLTAESRIRNGVSSPPNEVRIQHRDGAWRTVRTAAVPFALGGRPALMVSCMDVTEWADAEAVRRRAEEASRNLVENTLVGFSIIQDNRMVFCNRMLSLMSGYTQAEYYAMTSEQVLATVHEGDREMAGAFLASSFPPGAGRAQRVRFLSKGGEVRTVEVLATLTDFDSRPAIQVSYLDVTDSVEAERTLRESEQRLGESRTKLQNLAIYLLSAREEERKKVAREIHDEVGQVLTALKMDARWVEKRAGGADPELREKVRDMAALTDRAMETVHRVSSELRPGMLDHLGLAAALEWLVSDFSRRTGIPCRAVVAIPDGRIGGNGATDIFRIAQEGLTNVARHAKASAASLSVTESGDRLAVEVRDDGIGISAAHANAPDSFGLIGIRERVNALGGETEIGPAEGRGTLLSVSIPLPRHGAIP